MGLENVISVWGGSGKNYFTIEAYLKNPLSLRYTTMVKDEVENNEMQFLSVKQDPQEIEELLEENNAEIETADSASEAMEAARNDDYDILVVSQKSESEASLKSNELETIVDSLETVIYTLDEELNFRYANKTLREALGVEDIEGLNLSDLAEMGIVSREEIDEIKEDYKIAEEKGVSEDWEEITLLDGEKITVYSTIVPLPDGGYAGVVKDVTNLKKQKEKAELLTSVTGHDINNQLVKIEGYAELAKSEVQDKEVEEYLDKILSSVGKAHNITQKASQINELQKQENRAKKAIRLDNCLDSATNELLDFADENDIELFYSRPDDIEVMAGPMLEPLFYNLIENSIEHSNGDEVEVTAEIEDKYVDTYIRDDGIGIPESEQEGFWEPEKGLGTYLLSQITEMYDLELEIESAEGEGTEYRVRARKT